MGRISEKRIGAALEKHRGDRRLAAIEVGISYDAMEKRVLKNDAFMEMVAESVTDSPQVTIRDTQDGIESKYNPPPGELADAIHTAFDAGFGATFLIGYLPRLVLSVWSARAATLQMRIVEGNPVAIRKGLAMIERELARLSVIEGKKP